ncbi:MAG: hypothetical protein CL596_02125 [Alteromonas sp.]|nr:hypothetical protein [Alteromonas sp.]MAY22490.1 hypothetical protein [Flavobacteriaceae bacterium]
MKLITLGALLYLLLPSGSVSTVYICNGPQSKKYHLQKDCRGLSRCSTDIYKVDLSKAKSMGRTLCGWED